jgi:hypothetical protein
VCLSCPVVRPSKGDLQDIRRLPARATLESKKLQFLGWRGPAKAIKTIKKVALSRATNR